MKESVQADDGNRSFPRAYQDKLQPNKHPASGDKKAAAESVAVQSDQSPLEPKALPSSTKDTAAKDANDGAAPAKVGEAASPLTFNTLMHTSIVIRVNHEVPRCR